MDPPWSETCWSTFKYFIILIISKNYIFVHLLVNKVFNRHWRTVQTWRTMFCCLIFVVNGSKVLQDVLQMWAWRREGFCYAREDVRTCGKVPKWQNKCCWWRPHKLYNHFTNGNVVQVDASDKDDRPVPQVRLVICTSAFDMHIPAPKQQISQNTFKVKNPVDIIDLNRYCGQTVQVEDVGDGNQDGLTGGGRGREETSAHILCECEALASLRHAYLGSFILEPEDIRSLGLGSHLEL